LTAAYEGDLAAGRRVLIIVITDGEPSDGSPDDLYGVLNSVLSKHKPNLYISFTECNDNEEEMAYLDGWDQRLPNFDNSDDYGLEAARVKAAQASRGKRVRFTYADYVVKVILGAVLRKYFNIDQGGYIAGLPGSGGGSTCCTIL